METEQAWVNQEELVNNIDELIDKICIDLQDRNHPSDQVRNDEVTRDADQNILQTSEFFERLKDQIRQLQQQEDNVRSQYQPMVTSASSNLKEINQVENIITKIKADLPTHLSFQQILSQAYHKTGIHLKKGEFLDEDELNLDYQRIINEPLYGIDFSDQFYHNEEMTQALEEYRAIVTYFCERGSNRQSLKSTVQINSKLSLNVKDFSTKLAIVFKTTYRKLQQDLFNIYKQIIRLEEDDLKTLYRLLFNHNQYLTEQQLNTWCSLMKKAFNMPAEVSSAAEIHLYKLLMVLIKDNRLKDNSPYYAVSDEQNKTTWNKQIETDMCRLYLTHRNIRTVLKELTHKQTQNTGERPPFLTERMLRSHFEHILLRSLKKAELQFNKIDLNRNYPVLLKTREHRIILRTSEALPTRLLLLKLHLNSQISLNNIYEINKSVYSLLNSKLPALNGKVLTPTRRSEIKAQMRANLNSNTRYQGPQQSEASQSMEEIQPQLRRRKNRYIIESDEDQMPEYKATRSKQKEREPSTGKNVHDKAKKQLTIMETYQQKQQKLRNNIPANKNTDYSRQIQAYNQSRGSSKPNSGNTYPAGQKNRTDLIVNDITRKIRMDLSVKRPRR